MSTARKIVATTALAAAIVVPTAMSWGSEKQVSVQVAYVAPNGCPASDAFVAEVQWRESLVRVRAASDESADFAVTIHASGHGFVGSIRKLGPGGFVSDRQIEAETCSEVASALALSVALTLDPNARAVPSASTSSSAVAPSASASAAPPPPSASAAPPPPSASAAPRPPSTATPPHEQRKNPSAEWWLGADFVLDPHVIASNVVTGGALSLATVIDNWVSWNPVIRLNAFWTVDNQSSGGRSAKVQWFGGRIDACAPLYRASRSFQLAPCFDIGIGAIYTEGVTGVMVANSQKAINPWVDVGLSLLVKWLVADSFALEALGGPTVPLTQYSFEFDPTKQLLFQTQQVGARAWFGAAWRIP